MTSTSESARTVINRRGSRKATIFAMMQRVNRYEVLNTRRALRRDQTRCEEILWRALRGSQVEGVKFRRQVSMGSFILDFYASELKLAIEADGASHVGNEAYDAWRQHLIEKEGVTFLRFTDEEIWNRSGRVVEEIRAYIKAHRSTK